MSGYAMPNNKPMKDALRLLDRAGWRISGGGNRHYRALAPDGVFHLTAAASPKNPTQEARLMLRRAGLDRLRRR